MKIFIPDTTRLTADEIREIRSGFDLTVCQMSEKFGLSDKTWSNWESNGCSPAWSFLVREIVDGAVDDISQTHLPSATINELVELVGGYTKFYKALGISNATLNVWKKKGAPGQLGWGRTLTIMAEINGIVRWGIRKQISYTPCK